MGQVPEGNSQGIPQIGGPIRRCPAAKVAADAEYDHEITGLAGRAQAGIAWQVRRDLDILEVEPKNQSALILLLLSLTDQFGDSHFPIERALALLPRLNNEYHQMYYQVVIYERQARAQLHRTAPGGGSTAYHLLREAMRCYEAAENIRPADNDEALLRWNTCARTIMSGNLQPSPMDDTIIMLE